MSNEMRHPSLYIRQHPSLYIRQALLESDNKLRAMLRTINYNTLTPERLEEFIDVVLRQGSYPVIFVPAGYYPSTENTTRVLDPYFLLGVQDTNVYWSRHNVNKHKRQTHLPGFRSSRFMALKAVLGESRYLGILDKDEKIDTVIGLPAGWKYSETTPEYLISTNLPTL